MSDRLLRAALAAVVVIAVFPGIAAAEPRVGSTVTVADGESIHDDVRAVGATVVVEGWVHGNLTVVGGDAVVTGRVTGTVTVIGGSVEFGAGTADDARVVGGIVDVTDQAIVAGDVMAAGGQVAFDGSVNGDAELGGQRLRVGPNASVGGSLGYAGPIDLDDAAQIGGTLDRRGAPGAGVVSTALGIPGPAALLAGLLLNLAAGALLLSRRPRFALRVLGGVASDPVRSALAGVVVTAVVGVGLSLALVPVAGVPVAIAAAVAGGLLLWLGSLYGRIAAGAWLLSRIDAETRWRALGAGAAVVALAGLVPNVGLVVHAGVALVGTGALTLALRD